MQGEFIGKASKDTRLSIDTIRFYESLGLIEHPARTKGGFRRFGAEDIRDLRVISNLLDLGFSLSELKRVLGLRRRHMDNCIDVRDLLRRKLVRVRVKIRFLRRLEWDSERDCEDNRSPRTPRVRQTRSGVASIGWFKPRVNRDLRLL